MRKNLTKNTTCTTSPKKKVTSQNKIVISFCCPDETKQKSAKELLQNLFTAHMANNDMSPMFAYPVKFERTSSGSLFFSRDLSSFELHLLPIRDGMAIPKYLATQNPERNLVPFFDFILFLGFCSQIAYLFFEDIEDGSSEVYLTRLEHGCVELLNNRIYHNSDMYCFGKWVENGFKVIKDIFQKIILLDDPDGYESIYYDKRWCKEWDIENKIYPMFFGWLIHPATHQIFLQKSVMDDEKKEFIDKMKNKRKNEGYQFAKNTISAYANALFWNQLQTDSNKERLWKLCCKKLEINTALCYGTLTKIELEKVYAFLIEDKEAKQLDNLISRQTTSNAIRMLIRING